MSKGLAGYGVETAEDWDVELHVPVDARKIAGMCKLIGGNDKTHRCFVELLSGYK